MSLSRIIKSTHYEALRSVHTIATKHVSSEMNEINESNETTQTTNLEDESNELINRAKAEAELILAKAHEESRQLIDEAIKEKATKHKEQEAEWLRLAQEAREQAYQQGFEEGYSHGQQQGLLEQEQWIEAAQKVIEEAHQYKSSVIAEAEPFLISLSVSIARRILGAELEMNEESILTIVKEALLRAEGMKRVSICVNPEQFQIVQKHREEWMLLTDNEMEMKVVPDRKITFGSCVIRSEDGTIDAQIEVQLAQIKEQLMSIANGSRNDDV